MNIYYFFESEEDNLPNLSLSIPQKISGGSYCSKILDINGAPFYFQTPICQTKNGITCKKKIFCDLIFQNFDFLSWIERFEKELQYLIYEKRELWFENEMDLDDIEYFFNPSIRIFKKSNCLLRCYGFNEKKIKTNELKIFDTAHNIIAMQYLLQKTVERTEI